jgi:copper chaperone CopZ
MERLNLTIDGMSCAHCLNAVRGALGGVPGVQIDTVTIGRATVRFDPAATTVPQIVAAVAKAGYPAHPIAA